MEMGKQSLAKRIVSLKTFPLIVVLIAIVILFTVINPAYLTSTDNLRGMLNAMSLTGIIAVGVACLLISGGIDLSVGATGMFAGIMAGFFLQGGLPWGIALILAMLVGAAIGAFNAFLINGLNLLGFIATIGVASILEGLANVLTNAGNVTVSDASFFLLGSTAVFKVFSVPFLIMVALMVIYGVILSKTRFGRIVYMCGGNPAAAKMCGLNPKKITSILYINGGMLAALGGVVLTARLHTASPSAVLGQEFNAITAAVLGGIAFLGGSGSMAGCFIGLLLLTCFTNGLTFIGLGAFWTVIARGGLLIAALTVDYFNQRSQLQVLKGGKP